MEVPAIPEGMRVSGDLPGVRDSRCTGLEPYRVAG